jgi:hypothetical protein
MEWINIVKQKAIKECFQSINATCLVNKSTYYILMKGHIEMYKKLKLNPPKDT